MGELMKTLRARATTNPDWFEGLREVTSSELHDAIRLGTIVNHRDSTGALVEIRADEDYSGAFLETPEPTAHIDADTLAAVIRSYSGLDRGERDFDPRGLRLRQVVIHGARYPSGARGGLNLNGIDSPFTLGFEGCVFHGGLSMERAVLPGLSFDSCAFVEAMTGIQLARTTIAGDLTFFGVEGLEQLFAPGASFGTFSVRGDGIELPEGGARRFRTVLNGARIGELHLDGDADPHEVMPAGACAGLSVERVSLHAWDEARGRTQLWKADWVARWLSGGTPPSRWRPLGSWHDEPDRAHDRAAWATLATAMTDAGYESIRGVRYQDQGTRLRLLADRHRDSRLGLLPRLLRWLALDVTVGYFTAKLRALGWLAACWLLVSLLAWFSIHELWRGVDAAGGAIIPPADPLAAGADGVGWALAYGLDVIIAPLDLGFDAVWPTSIGLLAGFAIVKMISIGLLGLCVVGLTGVADRSGRAG